MQAETRSDALIVGGGLGGLTAAVVLARRGLSVRVLERARGFSEVGAGIQLAPNATRILASLGLMDEIESVGVLPRRLVLADAVEGHELASLDLTDFEERYGGRYVVLHRSDLLKILLEAARSAGVQLETRAEVTEVNEDASFVRVGASDGREFSAHVLVAADGLHSQLRRMFIEDEVVCSGYVAYRGAIPMDQVARHADLRDVVAWIGPRVHLVQYPLRSGALYNQVAVFHSPSFEAGDPDWGNPGELDERFSVCCEHVRESVPLLGREHRWPMYDRLPTMSWFRGRVALLGDAAHPMLQYLAQGACQAMEDADALGQVLGGRDLSSIGNVTEALTEYQDDRAPHAAAVQRAARAWGEIWHMDGVSRALRNEYLGLRTPTDQSHVDWLYGHHRAGTSAVADPLQPSSNVHDVARQL